MVSTEESVINADSRWSRHVNHRRAQARRQSRVLGVELLEDRRLLSANGESMAIEALSVSAVGFVENSGQWSDDTIRYVAESPHINVVAALGEVKFQMASEEEESEDHTPDHFDPLGAREPDVQVPEWYTEITLRFEGSSSPQPLGADRLETVVNYCVGDEESWRSNVPAFSTIAYVGLYEGIDYFMTLRDGRLKGEFHVASGARPEDIRMRWDGAADLSINEQGDLHIETALGDLIDQAPYIYQVIDGDQIEVEGEFELLSSDSVGFTVTGAYDPDALLIIDPEVEWATYVDFPENKELDPYSTPPNIAIDSQNNVLFFDPGNRLTLGRVGSVSPEGDLRWIAILDVGPSDSQGIAVNDATGEVAVVGQARWLSERNGAQVAKLSSTGFLAWQKPLESEEDNYYGQGWDSGVAFGSQGEVLVAAAVQIPGPVLGAPMLWKYSNAGTLLSRTALSTIGSGDESSGYLHGIRVDSDGNAYVIGELVVAEDESPNVGLLNALNSRQEGGDRFVAMVDSNDNVVWSRYLGGDGVGATDIALDSEGNLLLSGASLAKVASDGTLIWVTPFGGSNSDWVEGIAVTLKDEVVIVGATVSLDLPQAVNTFHGEPVGYGYNEAFLAKFSADGDLLWSRYFGGTGSDIAYDVEVDRDGNAVIVGDTNSTDGDFEDAKGAIDEHPYPSGAFVAKINILPDLSIEPDDIVITPTGVGDDIWDAPFEITATVHSNATVPEVVESVDVKLIRKRDGIELDSIVEVIPQIEHGESEEVSIHWILDPLDEVEVFVDPDHKLVEADRNNNLGITSETTGQIINSDGEPLSHALVYFDQMSAGGLSTRAFTVTDDDGVYVFWNNLDGIEDGALSSVRTELAYSINDTLDDLAYRILQVDGRVVTVSLPELFVIDKRNDTTVDTIAVSDEDGGVVYTTLDTLYQYHEQNRMPDGSTTLPELPTDAYVNCPRSQSQSSSHHPAICITSKSVAKPSVIAHEYTHQVERQWAIYPAPNHVLGYPVEEASATWGGLIALDDSVYEYGEQPIDISLLSHTNGSEREGIWPVAVEEFQMAGVMWDMGKTLGGAGPQDAWRVWETLNFWVDKVDGAELGSARNFYLAYKQSYLDSRPIKPIFKAHEIYTGGWPGEDGIDPDFYTGFFSDYRLDEDARLGVEYLVVDVELNIAEPGQYLLYGDLADTSLCATTWVELQEGIQTVSMRFRGEDMFSAGQDGPFVFSSYLMDSDYNILDFRDNIYVTHEYDHEEFEPPAVYYTGYSNDWGVDVDGDGTYDVLNVELEVAVNTPGEYLVYGSLSSDDHLIYTPDDAAGVYAQLEAGTQWVTLQFDGTTIRAAGFNGPYKVMTSVPKGSAIMTSAYAHSEFEMPFAALGTVAFDDGIDEDADGLFDWLEVGVEVNSILSGTLTLTGSLSDATGHIVASSHVTRACDAGLHVGTLRFDGVRIRQQGSEGPYSLAIGLYDEDGRHIGQTSGTTLQYSYTEFQKDPSDYYTLALAYVANDSDTDGEVESIAVDMNVTSDVRDGLTRFDAYLYGSSGAVVSFSRGMGEIGQDVSQVAFEFVHATAFEPGDYELVLDIFDENQHRVVTLKDIHTVTVLPPVRFTGYYSEFLKDVDGEDTTADGIPDYLTVTAEVVADTNWPAWMQATLVDRYGQSIDTAETWLELLAGEPQVVEMNFSASAIYDHGVDGPYVVEDWVVELYEAGQGKFDIADSYETQPYAVNDFHPLLVYLTDNYSEYLKDLDEDGLADYLAITAEVSTRIAGETVVYAALVDSTGEWIIDALSFAYLEAGQTHTFELNFDGGIINSHGADGPFSIVDLDVTRYTLDGDVVASDYEEEPYATAAYGVAEFEMYEQRIVATDYFDFLKDVNADGIPDYMTIGANVTGVYSGEAGAWFELRAPGGWGFAWGDTFMNLQAGEPQIIAVDVPIGPILANGTDGPFVVAAGFVYVNGSEYYIPDAHLTHPYRLSDLDGSGVNHAPVASDVAVVTDEDTPVAVTLSATDVESSPLSYAIIIPPQHGTLSGTAPDLTYTPNAEWNGTDTFTYQANDGELDSNIATATIDVAPVNDAPVATDVAVLTDEDIPVAVTLSATDVESSPLSYAIIIPPQNGTLSGTAPDLNYTPNAEWNGTDTFTYQANDGELDSNVATATIDVAPVNDAPVATDVAVVTDEDTPVAVTLSATDVESSPLSYAIIIQPQHGTLSGTAPDLNYTPNAEWNGTDTFTYQANDGELDSNIATATIDVAPVNDAPVATDVSVPADEDTPVAVTLSATDVESSPLSYAIIIQPQHGTLSGTAPDLTYTPNAEWNGTDTFTYQANDGELDSNTATATIDVAPVNDVPVASDVPVLTDEDTPVAVPLAATDVEGDLLSYVIITPPQHGTLSGTAPALTYTPGPDWNGTDSFTYQANDGELDSNIATVTLTVNAVNDAPVAIGDAYTTDEDTELSVPLPGVLGNDDDVDGDALAAVLVSDVSNGTLTLSVDGSFVYTPDADWNGTDSFTYQAQDPDLALSEVVTVTLAVNAVNDAPVATGDAYDTNEDTQLTVPVPGVLGNDDDVDGDALAAVLVSDVSNGTLTLSVDGSFVYTPDADWNGTDSFTYQAQDPDLALSEVVTVTLTVNAVNDAPVAIGDAYTADEDTPLSVPLPGVLGNDDDVDGDALTAVLVSDVSNGTLTLNGDGSLLYTPDANWNGTDSFTYQAQDPDLALSAEATVTIVVREVNDPPTANPDGPYTVDEGSSVVLDGSGSSDPDQSSASLIFEWDFDYDGVTFDVDATGISPTFDALSLEGPLTFTVALRVTDTPGASHIATTTLSIGDGQSAEFTCGPPAAGTAGNVFLQCSGPITVPGETVDLPFQITPDEFTLAGGFTRLGLELASPDGSLDPAPVAVQQAAGGAVASFYNTPDVAGSDSSLILVQLGFGDYTISVGAEDAATGNVTLNIILLGDLDGDHEVTRGDNTAIRGLLGASVGDARYQREADSDLDGDIDTFDYLECRRNIYDAVNMFQPLMLAASVVADSGQSDAEFAAYQLEPMISTMADESAAIDLAPLSHDLMRKALQLRVRGPLRRAAEAAGHRPPLSGGEYTRTVDEVFATKRAHEERATGDRLTSDDAEVLSQMAPWRISNMTRRVDRFRIQTSLPGNSSAGGAEEPERNVFEDLLGFLARDKVQTRTFR